MHIKYENNSHLGGKKFKSLDSLCFYKYSIQICQFLSNLISVPENKVEFKS